MTTTNDYPDLLGEAVRVLTAAGRQTRTIGAGTADEHTEPADFAEFVALALAGAAANIGSIDDLLAGRPGSWEASYVRELLAGTVGADGVDLARHRTEPPGHPTGEHDSAGAVLDQLRSDRDDLDR